MRGKGFQVGEEGLQVRGGAPGEGGGAPGEERGSN